MTVLSITRGDHQSFLISLTDGDGAALDLVAVDEIRFTAKRDHSHTDLEAVIRKTIGDGIEIVDEDLGTARITLEPEDTTTIDAPYSYFWDVQIERADGDVRTPLSGVLRIKPDVTRTATA